ncbi:MAG: hypothetical protein O2931_01870, partial [Planctomycetota bacterium]|nr:hypothetical protein [Planctomycetota bacterium]
QQQEDANEKADPATERPRLVPWLSLGRVSGQLSQLAQGRDCQYAATSAGNLLACLSCRDGLGGTAIAGE